MSHASLAVSLRNKEQTLIINASPLLSHFLNRSPSVITGEILVLGFVIRGLVVCSVSEIEETDV